MPKGLGIQTWMDKAGWPLMWLCHYGSCFIGVEAEVQSISHLFKVMCQCGRARNLKLNALVPCVVTVKFARTELLFFFPPFLILLLYWTVVDLQCCIFQVYSEMIQLYMYLFFFKFFSHLGYYRILSRVPVLYSRSLLIIYFKYSRVYMSVLVAQTVKNLPAVQKTWVQSLGQEDPWRRAWQPPPVVLPGESPWTEEPGGL